MSFKIRVAKAAELADGLSHVYNVDANRKIVLRQIGQTVYAFEDRCSHDDGDLAGGSVLEGAVMECPRHGGRFDLKTGKALRMPAIAGIQVYPVEIRDGDIWITVDKEAPSDEQ